MTIALKAVDMAAAGIFAAATGFAVSTVADGIAATLAVPAGFALAYAALTRVDTGHRHRLAQFELAPLDTHSDAPLGGGDERVVRLFDPRQLAIARPSEANSGCVPPDAGQALSDALAELKRSLR